MPRKSASRSAKSRTPAKVRAPGSANAVACWEDDPGDPAGQPPLTPITIAVPSQSATSLPFKIRGKAPRPAIYHPGTPSFLYYAAVAALARTAAFWSDIVPSGTRWQVGKVLPVALDSGVDLNAFYTRGDGGDPPGLHFFHDSVRGRVFFSGESPDVACHEMGHAVLDALRPELFDAQTIEAAAFHESFGDMTAILSALQVPSFREEVLKETAGQLNRASRLSRLAEQLGAAIRVSHPDAVSPDCLRNAVNSFFYRDPQTLPPNGPASQISSEPHSFSRIFTAAFLDALAGIFKSQSASTPDALTIAARDAGRLLAGAILAAPVVPDYYSQVAASMVQVGDEAPFGGKYHDVLKSAFVRRGILSLQAASALVDAPRETVRSSAIAPSTPARRGAAPMVSIPAAPYGLTKNVLMVHVAAEPKRLAVTGSSLTLGPVEPRSPQSAAEAYTEDLFQRGHVEVGRHAHEEAGLVHPFSFKTHIVTEKNGALVLERITFDCGLHGALDRP